jgi:hypothetical protein
MKSPGKTARPSDGKAAANGNQGLQFSGAELAIIYQLMLGEQWPGQHVLADLGARPADLFRAQRSLLARGVVRRMAPGGAPTVHPAAEALFSTVLFPQILGILKVSEAQQPERTVNLSWRSGWTVLNKVDAAGTHLLVPLTSAKAVADALLHESGLDEPDGEANQPRVDATAPDSAGAVAQKASLSAQLLVTYDPASPVVEAEAIGWLRSEGQVWLIAQQDEATAAMNPISRAELQALLVNFARQASDLTGGEAQPPT